MKRPLSLLTCFLTLLFLLGCNRGPQEPVPVPVHGTVMLDDQPLPEGEILFKIPGQVPAFTEIRDGKYSLQVKPGKKEVEVLAYRMGKDFDMGGVIIKGTKENYIPERYNTKTTLKAEITPEGPNEFHFKVTSK